MEPRGLEHAQHVGEVALDDGSPSERSASKTGRVRIDRMSDANGNRMIINGSGTTSPMTSRRLSSSRWSPKLIIEPLNSCSWSSGMIQQGTFPESRTQAKGSWIPKKRSAF